MLILPFILKNVHRCILHVNSCELHLHFQFLHTTALYTHMTFNPQMLKSNTAESVLPSVCADTTLLIEQSKQDKVSILNSFSSARCSTSGQRCDTAVR